MRTIVPLVMALALAGPLSAQTIQSLPPGAEARQARLLGHIGPEARGFIQAEAHREATSGASEARARRAAETHRAQLGVTTGADIDALIFLVMMQVNQDAEADLRQEMAQMQAIQGQKAGLRQHQAGMKAAQAASRADLAQDYAALQASGRISPDLTFDQFVAARQIQPVPPTPPSLDAAKGQIKSGLDSQSEMGEMASMRLQMATDRRAKAIETLSNLMKRTSDTDASIVSNLK